MQRLDGQGDPGSLRLIAQHTNVVAHPLPGTDEVTRPLGQPPGHENQSGGGTGGACGSEGRGLLDGGPVLIEGTLAAWPGREGEEATPAVGGESRSILALGSVRSFLRSLLVAISHPITHALAHSEIDDVSHDREHESRQHERCQWIHVYPLTRRHPHSSEALETHAAVASALRRQLFQSATSRATHRTDANRP